MREKDEKVKYAKSMNREYQMLKNRLGHVGQPQIEIDYLTKMVNNVKSKIDFSLLNSKKREQKEEYSYNSDDNNYYRK